MTLVQSWMDSLQLLKPKNLEPFVNDTLKSIREAYKLMFKYFWWLIALQLMCYIPLIAHRSPFLSIGSFSIVYQLLFFIVCLIARPSSIEKNYAYFRSHLRPLIYFVPFKLVIFAVESVLTPLGGQIFPFSAWPIFFILFFLDSKNDSRSFFASVWSALHMIIFNFPIILCVHGALWLFESIIFFIINLIAIGTVAHGISNLWNVGVAGFFYIALIYGIIGILLLPIGICTYANIYSKKLHDQSDLYAKLHKDKA